MSNQTSPRPRKSNTLPVIMYPEGVVVGKVRSGKNSAGRVRHVATTAAGERLGTFDMYREASDALIARARKTSETVAAARQARVAQVSSREPVTHHIPMSEATEERGKYGITHLSTYVYDARRRLSAPTRIVAWSNVSRPTKRNGEPVRVGDYGRRDGGNGIYLDPHNVATDCPISILLTPEASVLSAHGDSTGTEASGQVFANEWPIREGDVIVLLWPDGTESTHGATFAGHGNGHGELTEAIRAYSAQAEAIRAYFAPAELTAKLATGTAIRRHLDTIRPIISSGIVTTLINAAWDRMEGAMTRMHDGPTREEFLAALLAELQERTERGESR